MFVSDKQRAGDSWSPLPHCFVTDMGVTLLCWERETWSNMRKLMWSCLVCYWMLFSMLSNETWRTCFRRENKIWDFIVLKKSEVVKIKRCWTTKWREIKEDFLEMAGWAGFLNEERYWSWKEWLTNLGRQWRKQEWHEWNCVLKWLEGRQSMRWLGYQTVWK